MIASFSLRQGSWSAAQSDVVSLVHPAIQKYVLRVPGRLGERETCTKLIQVRDDQFSRPLQFSAQAALAS